MEEWKWKLKTEQLGKQPHLPEIEEQQVDRNDQQPDGENLISNCLLAFAQEQKVKKKSERDSANVKHGQQLTSDTRVFGYSNDNFIRTCGFGQEKRRRSAVVMVRHIDQEIEIPVTVKVATPANSGHGIVKGGMTYKDLAGCNTIFSTRKVQAIVGNGGPI